MSGEAPEVRALSPLSTESLPLFNGVLSATTTSWKGEHSPENQLLTTTTAATATLYCFIIIILVTAIILIISTSTIGTH